MWNRKKIVEFSTRYETRYPQWVTAEKNFLGWFRNHSHLDKKTFVKLGMWKSPRPKRFYLKNPEKLVHTITSLALQETDEESKVKLLMTLEGISWSTASVILHFASPNKYPILDFRAVWSLGWKQPPSYSFDFWEKYLRNWRNLIREFHLPGRKVDRALWQYSKEHQQKRGTQWVNHTGKNYF